jgi:integrase/recombinase XerD
MAPFTATAFELKDIPVPEAFKNDRHGQARVLNAQQLTAILNAMPSEKWRLIFAIAYFTGSRISEVLKLKREDLTELGLTFRSANTKTRSTRQANYHPTLVELLDTYPLPESGYLFPARHNGKRWDHLCRQAADAVLREACAELGLDGVSTHSFRRSFVSNMTDAGYTLNQIRRFTGHKSLNSLAVYQK